MLFELCIVLFNKPSNDNATRWIAIDGFVSCRQSKSVVSVLYWLEFRASKQANEQALVSAAATISSRHARFYGRQSIIIEPVALTIRQTRIMWQPPPPPSQPTNLADHNFHFDFNLQKL